MESIWQVQVRLGILGYFLLMLSSCIAEECRTVTSVKSVCLTDSSPTSVDISCPPGYRVIVEAASFIRSRYAGCSTVIPSSADSCTAGSVTTEFREQCYGPVPTNISDILNPEVKDSCLVDVNNLTKPVDDSQCSTDYSGAEYIVVYYRCDAQYSLNGTAWAISMCESGTGYESSLLAINSALPISDNETGALIYTKEYADCHCSFLVPAHTELQMNAKIFTTSDSSGSCAQRVNITERGGGIRYSFCSSNRAVPVRLDCATEERIYDVTYDTDNVNVGSIFIIELKVNYEMEVRIVCGPNASHEENPLQIIQTSSEIPLTSPTATLPDTPPTATLPDTPPTATLPDTPPAATLPDTPPTATVTLPDTPPTATLPDTPPAVTLPDTPPTATLPDTPPTATLPDTPPTATLPDTPPTATLPDTPPAATLPDTPPTATLPDTPPTATLRTTLPTFEPVSPSQPQTTLNNIDEVSTTHSVSQISTAAVIGLIVGCLLAVIILLALIISIFYIKCRNTNANRRTKSSHHSNRHVMRSGVPHVPTVETMPHRQIYVTDMYLEGDRSSQFVLERPAYRSPYMRY